MREYASVEAARRAFEEYARLEPQLTPLWSLCERATPSVAANDDDGEADTDLFMSDPFETDIVNASKPDDGWCAEDYFFRDVKPLLVLLVGHHRTERDPPELREAKAYEAVYSALFHHALRRPCACCSEVGSPPLRAQA